MEREAAQFLRYIQHRFIIYDVTLPVRLKIRMVEDVSAALVNAEEVHPPAVLDGLK